jgi:hypothetical protein
VRRVALALLVLAACGGADDDACDLATAGCAAPGGELAPVLHALIDGFPGDVAVAVRDLQTGQDYAIAGDRPHKAASTIKLFMISAALDRIDDGLPPSTIEAIQPFVDETFRISTDEPTGEILTMMGDGDQQLGGELVNAHLADLGMADSRVVHWFGFDDPAGVDDAAPIHGNNRFTALDCVHGLEAIRTGRTYDAALAAAQLDRLHDLNPFQFLRRDLPLDRAWVADKVGFIDAASFGPEHQAINDIGIVELLDEVHPMTGAPPAYAIAVLVQTDHEEHTVDEAIDLVAHVSRATFDWYDARF